MGLLLLLMLAGRAWGQSPTAQGIEGDFVYFDLHPRSRWSVHPDRSRFIIPMDSLQAYLKQLEGIQDGSQFFEVALGSGIPWMRAEDHVDMLYISQMVLGKVPRDFDGDWPLEYKKSVPTEVVDARMDSLGKCCAGLPSVVRVDGNPADFLAIAVHLSARVWQSGKARWAVIQQIELLPTADLGDLKAMMEGWALMVQAEHRYSDFRWKRMRKRALRQGLE